MRLGQIVTALQLFELASSFRKTGAHFPDHASAKRYNQRWFAAKMRCSAA
jgi:hypothetical protein